MELLRKHRARRGYLGKCLISRRNAIREAALDRSLRVNCIQRAKIAFKIGSISQSDCATAAGWTLVLRQAGSAVPPCGRAKNKGGEDAPAARWLEPSARRGQFIFTVSLRAGA